MTRRSRAASAAAVMLALGAAPSADAAVTFPDREVAAQGTIGMPVTVNDLAVGGDGTVGVVTTMGFVGGSGTAIVREPGGDFADPVPLSAPLFGGSGDLAIDREGNAIAISPEPTGYTWRHRPKGGTWSAPKPLLPPGTIANTIVVPRVAFLDDGSAIAVYASIAGGVTPAIEAVRRGPDGGDFSATATTLSSPGETVGGPLSVTPGPDARALVTWSRVLGTPGVRSRLLRGGVWEAATTVAEGAPAGVAPTVSFADDGALEMVWQELTFVMAGSPPMLVFGASIKGASRSATATGWRPSSQADTATSGSIPIPPLGVPDVAGGTAVWPSTQSADTQVRRADLRATGFAARSPLAAATIPTVVGAPQIERLGEGRKLVTWLEGMTPQYRVLAADGSEEQRGALTATTGFGGPAGMMVVDPASRRGAYAWTTGDVTGSSRVNVVSINDPAAPQPPAAPPTQPAPAAPAQPATQQAPSTAPAVDLVAPALERVRLTRSRFRVGAQPTALAAQRRRTQAGTELSWVSNEAGRVFIGVERPTRGFRAGRRCVAKRPKSQRGRARRCSLVVVRGTLQRKSVAGVNKLTFTGRLGRKALAAGRHRFAMIAVDAAGNRSAPKRVSFTVVKR